MVTAAGIILLTLGAIGAIVRGAMVVSPGWARDFLRWVLRHRAPLRAALVAMVLIGLFLLAAGGPINVEGLGTWPGWIVLGIGVVLVFAAVFFLVFPMSLFVFAARMKALDDTRLRLLALVGMLAALFIAFIGVVLL